jgi:HD superfamily phosphodiesterase
MTPRNQKLRERLEQLYKSYADTLLFHGWHHITFVARNSLEFAEELDVNKELVEAAALVHDLNYVTDGLIQNFGWQLPLLSSK